MEHRNVTSEEIRRQYPAYITQKEFAQLAGICIKTAYKLNRAGIVPYREVRTGFHHHYEILTEDAIRYVEAHTPEISSAATKDWRNALTVFLQNEADVLRLKDVVRISGIGKNSVDRWVKTGKLKAFKCRNVYRVTKEDLIGYLASPYYRYAHRKGEAWHRIAAFVRTYQNNNTNHGGQIL